MSVWQRVPSVGLILVVVLLLGSAGGVTWWVNRPRADPHTPALSLADLDVVCAGRVDGAWPTASLEPAIPGKVIEVLAREGQSVAAGQPLLRLDDELAKLRVEE
ncbi:MAG: biotin/lipoyl-binding protein, partial [Gemmataceae bacterium]|nr:biotin/lipoyl-binding protein [Gemmataceae bacterium]